MWQTLIIDLTSAVKFVKDLTGPESLPDENGNDVPNITRKNFIDSYGAPTHTNLMKLDTEKLKKQIEASITFLKKNSTVKEKKEALDDL